jgi:hypothetical protein
LNHSFVSSGFVVVVPRRAAMTVLEAELRFHVLAVDNNIIDRKLIEMLLRNSSYQGACRRLSLVSFSGLMNAEEEEMLLFWFHSLLFSLSLSISSPLN